MTRKHMKKIFFALFGAAIFLIGCGSNNSNPVAPNNGSEQSGASDSQTKVKIEEKTPQSWIDLFTFTNVTIDITYNLSMLKPKEYKCVDSIWYVKENGDAYFAEFKEDPATIYEIAYAHYSKFVYDENYFFFKAEKVKIDDSEYIYSITVMYDVNSTEKRIDWINIDAYVSDTLSIHTEMDFKDYGETSLFN